MAIGTGLGDSCIPNWHRNKIQLPKQGQPTTHELQITNDTHTILPVSRPNEISEMLTMPFSSQMKTHKKIKNKDGG